jgi:hypothetical protein
MTTRQAFIEALVCRQRAPELADVDESWVLDLEPSSR